MRLFTWALSHPETHCTSTHWSQHSEDRNGEEHTGNQTSVSHRLRRSELRFTRTFSSHETGCSKDSSRLAQGQMSQHRCVRLAWNSSLHFHHCGSSCVSSSPESVVVLVAKWIQEKYAAFYIRKHHPINQPVSMTRL